MHIPLGCPGADLPPNPEAVYTAIAQVGALGGRDVPGHSAPSVALSGHLGLVGMHPLAPGAPLAQFPVANGLQVAPMVALSGHLGLVGLHPPAPRAPAAQSLAAAGLQLPPLVALSGHLRLEGKHPPAPRAPVVQFLAATGLQVAPMVAPSGHLGLVGMHPPSPAAPSHSSRQPPGFSWRRWWRSRGIWG